MYDASDLIDDAALVFTLLERDKPPGSRCAADLDVQSIEHLPFITYAITGGGQDGNGPGLWEATLVVNVFGADDEAWGACTHLYRKIHGWDLPGAGVVEDVGSVQNVGDLSKFSRLVSGVQMLGKSVTQYVGSFDLTLKN